MQMYRAVKKKRKPKVVEGHNFDRLGGYCELEYKVASAIINQECCSVEDVCSKFDLTSEEAITILDSRPFLKLFDGLVKFRNIGIFARAINALERVLDTGSNEERLEAFDLLQQLIGE